MRMDRENGTHWFWSWRTGLVLCLTALALVTIVAVISVNVSQSKEPKESPKSSDTEVFELVERNEWLAEPSSAPLNRLSELPAPFVIISHTATEPCTTRGECVFRVRMIQNFHMESRNFSDIGYNFLVGGDGLVYIGRDWGVEGAHANGWNKKSIGLSFIGTFNDVVPSKPQLQAALKLMELGVKLKQLTSSYILLGHRQVSKNTLSPGQKLFEIIKTWKHWSKILSSELSLVNYNEH